MTILTEYSETTLDHFSNPRNVGVVAGFNGYGQVGDPGCGDVCEITVRINENIIEDIKFRVYGCTGAIATSSAITEMAKGKDLNYALKITDDEVVEYLGGLPDKKQHCSLLGLKVLKLAIRDHLLIYLRLVGEGKIKDGSDYGRLRKELLQEMGKKGSR